MAENYLVRNVNILTKLVKGPASIDDLAKYAGRPRGLLTVSLKVLTEQGFIKPVGDEIYSLTTSPEVNTLLGVMESWLAYTDNSYMELAKDTARIIRDKSWDEVAVQDVLLFGSTLKGTCVPDDIDMLLLHSGQRLVEFDRDPYSTRPSAMKESDIPCGEENRRNGAWCFFRTLGYKGTGKDDDRRRDDSAYENILKRLEFMGGNSSELVDSIFDVHVMHTGLLLAHIDPPDVPGSGYMDEYMKQQRAEAIKHCRDPTFWHTVLSEGRLYNPETHDFSLKVDDKYPGASDLFKQ
jgi:hypothetical protein